MPRAGGEIAGVFWLDTFWRGLEDFSRNTLAIAALVFSDLKFDGFAWQGTPNKGLLAVFERRNALSARDDLFDFCLHDVVILTD